MNEKRFTRWPPKTLIANRTDGQKCEEKPESGKDKQTVSQREREKANG